LDIRIKNGIYHLSGRIDEHAAFDSLVKAPTPLRLNVGGVTAINSPGVRRLLAFSMAWSPKKFELYDCTPEFIANVNAIPQLIGSPADESQIKTFFVPYSCELCKTLQSALFDRDDLVFDAKGEVVLLAQRCASCGELMDLDVDEAEYFAFLYGEG
jgi:hypothetical protein